MSEPVDKVCVVALVGKSQLLKHQTKAWKLNTLLMKQIFKTDPVSKEQTDEEKTAGFESSDSDKFNDYAEAKSDNLKIQRYFDRKSNVVYLHLQTYNDSDEIIRILATSTQSDDQKLFDVFENEQSKYIRALLLLFSVSHIIIVSTPTCSFDIGYVRLFRILDTFRVKMLPSMVDYLKSLNLPISKDWLYAGRPCAPRVLFTFENACASLGTSDEESLEKLQHSLEDQIYQSLRKSYVITNISNNSLFAIPPNQEFVYVHRFNNDHSFNNKFLISNLINECQTKRPTKTTDALSEVLRSNKLDAKLFRRFVFEHINVALNEGFNDNIGRSNVNPLFELPKADTWFRLFEQLFAYYLSPSTKSNKLHGIFSQLKANVDIDAQYSENRCKKALPQAFALYQETLPSHYTKAQHQQRLDKAIAIYDAQARGPAYSSYLEQLKHDCLSYWLNSRQSCEAVSLTSNPCLLELHRTPDEIVGISSGKDKDAEKETKSLSFDLDDESDTESLSSTTTRSRSYKNQQQKMTLLNRKNINDARTSSREFVHSKSPSSNSISLQVSVKPHNSSIVTVAASNCGEIQRERKDPFDLREANYTFYSEFPPNPKRKATVYEFDTFYSKSKTGVNRVRFQEQETTQSKLSVPPSMTTSSSEDALAKLNLLKRQKQIESKQQYENMFPPLINEQQNQPQSQTENRSLPADEKPSPSSITNSMSSLQIDSKSEPPIESAQPVETPNTNQHLPGMVHSMSPPGLLPLFSSWSLVSIGKATDYNPSTGLTQPGFLPGHNYLIPWEIGVSNDTVIMLCEKFSRRNKELKTVSSQPSLNPVQSMITFKAYIGMEYECPLGHRFICSGPDRIVKASSNGNLKDDAFKLLNCDMPLYTACPCRDSKDSTPYMAQMMRIFVVTPSSTSLKSDTSNPLGRNGSSNQLYQGASSQANATLNIVLKTRVQPNPLPCPIYSPSNQGPIWLAENNIWILRMPYIYMGDDEKIYYRPKDFETLNNCKVLKGMFGTYLSNKQ